MSQTCSHHHHHNTNETRTLWAALLISSFMLVEVLGGFWTGSLALLADAGHMLTDALSLTLAWWAFRISRRPAGHSHTYGWGRMQVLAGYTNAIALLFVVGWIAVEALHRVITPTPVLGGPMLVIAAMGLLVNIIVFAILHGAERDNPNIRGALLHVAGDLLGSVAALVAAGLILQFGWLWADPLLSVLVCLILLRSCWFLLKSTAHTLLEGTPANLNPTKLAEELARNVPEISSAHHIHAWEVSHRQTAVTLHAHLKPAADLDTARQHIHQYLKDAYGVSHVTVQLEHQLCAEQTCA